MLASPIRMGARQQPQYGTAVVNLELLLKLSDPLHVSVGEFDNSRSYRKVETPRGWGRNDLF